MRVGTLHRKNDDSVQERAHFCIKFWAAEKNPKNIQKQKRRFRARVGEFGQKNDDFVQEWAHFRGGGKNDDSVWEGEYFLKARKQENQKPRPGRASFPETVKT